MANNDDHDLAEQLRRLWCIWQEALPLTLWSRSCFLVHFLILLILSPHTPQSTAPQHSTNCHLYSSCLVTVEHIYNNGMLWFGGGVVFIKGWTHHPPQLSEWLDIRTGSLHTLPAVWIHTSTPGIYSHLICQSDRTGDRECLSRGAEGIP